MTTEEIRSAKVHSIKSRLQDLHVIRGDMMASVGTVEALIAAGEEELSELGEELISGF